MRPVDVLAATRDRLIAKGWTPGIGRCLYMTMGAVVSDEEWYGPAPQVGALAALRRVTDSDEITTWNSQQESVDRVLYMIDHAIAMLTVEAQP